jgi:hypothetical protein
LSLDLEFSLRMELDLLEALERDLYLRVLRL